MLYISFHCNTSVSCGRTAINVSGAVRQAPQVVGSLSLTARSWRGSLSSVFNRTAMLGLEPSRIQPEGTRDEWLESFPWSGRELNNKVSDPPFMSADTDTVTSSI